MGTLMPLNTPLPVTVHLLDNKWIMFHYNHDFENVLENTYYHISWYQSVLGGTQSISLFDKLNKIVRELEKHRNHTI